MKTSEKYYIILVNYNGWADTIECLDSVLKSSYHNFQVIVVDNCSTDDSIFSLKDALSRKGINYAFYSGNNVLYGNLVESENANDDSVIIIHAEENRGFAAGNNIGIAYAKLKNDSAGVILLNNDTVVEKSAFENLVKAKNQNENPAIYSGKILYYSEPETIWFDGGKMNLFLGKTSHIGYDSPNSSSCRKIKKVSFITFCYVLIPWEIIDKIGLLDESYFMYFEDTDYCYKVYRNNFCQYIVEDSIIYHKVGKGSGGKFSPFLFYWYYRNFIVFNRRRRDFLKVLSLIIITLSRPLIFIKILLRNRNNASRMLKATIDGYRYKI